MTTRESEMQKEVLELRAQVNMLIEELITCYGTTYIDIVHDAANKALMTSKSKCLAEHDKKVIAEFMAKCEVVAEVIVFEMADFSEAGTTVDWHKTDFEIGAKFFTLPLERCSIQP
jgi:hypothetical protein